MHTAAWFRLDLPQVDLIKIDRATTKPRIIQWKGLLAESIGLDGKCHLYIIFVEFD